MQVLHADPVAQRRGDVEETVVASDQAVRKGERDFGGDAAGLEGAVGDAATSDKGVELAALGNV